MASEADLQEAIRAHPKDSGPVLVYADWLQERGDPRGEAFAVLLHEIPNIRKLLNAVHRTESFLYEKARKLAKHDVSGYCEARAAKRVRERTDQTYQLVFGSRDLTFTIAAWTNFKRDYLTFRQSDDMIFLHDWSERPRSYSSIGDHMNYYASPGLNETAIGCPEFRDAARQLDRFYKKIMKILRSQGAPIPTVRSIACEDVVRRFADGRLFSWKDAAESYHMATKAFGYEAEVRDGSQILSWLPRVAVRGLYPGKEPGTTVRRWRIKPEDGKLSDGETAAMNAGLRTNDQILAQYKRR